MKRLSTEHIKEIHKMMISETGGEDGIRDEGLLDSAASSPYHTYDGQPLYKTIEAKAARLCFALIRNHAFLDGNKRTGMMAMLVFLELNGAERDFSDGEVARVGLAIADGSMGEQELLIGFWNLNAYNTKKQPPGAAFLLACSVIPATRSGI